MIMIMIMIMIMMGIKPMKIMSNVRVFSTVILMLILAVIPVVQAKQIFYNSLDSEKAVKDGGVKYTLGLL